MAAAGTVASDVQRLDLNLVRLMVAFRDGRQRVAAERLVLDPTHS